MCRHVVARVLSSVAIVDMSSILGHICLAFFRTYVLSGRGASGTRFINEMFECTTLDSNVDQ